VRWDDPAFKIRWLNIHHRIVSEIDKRYVDFSGINIVREDRKQVGQKEVMK